MSSSTIWLIGAGPMAMEYAKVLKALDQQFKCITRSDTSAANFHSETGAQPYAGGLEAFLRDDPSLPTHAIVATGIESLSSVAELLLNAGVKSILLEKPAGIDIAQVESTLELATANSASVYVAYNRRFYASVQAAQQLIEEDGGVTSLNYEITEWSHVIKDVELDQAIKNRWFIANTSHVIDLAFFLGGKPQQLATFSNGDTAWHTSSANFSGAGVTQGGALFAYHGNWNAPGRWSLEVSTQHRRFIFAPMEQLKVQKLGSIAIDEIDLDYDLEQVFKPGIYRQTEAFLTNNSESLCALSEQLQNLQTYYQMANYTR